MKRFVPILLSVPTFFTLAQAQSLTLEAALARAGEQAPVVAARAELEDARTNLQRLLADPLLIRPSRVQAEQRATLAQASLDRAVNQARSSIVGAYAQVLEAQIQLRLAQKGLEIASRGLEIAQIRQRNGSGTALDVRSAQNRLDEARSNATRAETGLALAQSALRSLVGGFGSVSPLPTPPALPESGRVRELLENNPDLLQARQRAELASLQAELLDPSFAARAEIEAATARALQSREAARETERGLGIQYDSLLQNLQAAGRSLGIQQAALATATEALSAERRRLEAGLISTVAFLQAELASIQAELAAQQAQSSYWRAYYSLLTGGR